MNPRRCSDCLWWDDQHSSVADIPIQLGKMTPGFCRKHKPGSLRIELYFYGAQPIMDANEYCGEFRLKGEK